MEQEYAAPEASAGDQQGAVEQADDGLLGSAGSQPGLLGRIEVIESQPLDQRAVGFDQLAEELLAELQRSDGSPQHGEDVR